MAQNMITVTNASTSSFCGSVRVLLIAQKSARNHKKVTAQI